MEVNTMIVGAKLSEIQKRPDEVKLIFENARTGQGYVLKFDGLLFETTGSALNHRVSNFEVNNALGFRAITQLRREKKNPENYKQLFIQMEGSNEENKLELLGAFRHYKISLKRSVAAKKSN